MPDTGPALRGFLSRLLLGSRLTREEQQAILGLPGELVPAGSRHDLVRPAATVNHAILVADGLLARYDQMKDGARQITAFHVPGDMCDLHSVVAPITGWGITVLGASIVLNVPHAALREIARAYPAIALAFWRDTTLDASILAKWVANIGRKSSEGRIAHLFCEMGIRMERAGRGSRSRYELRATQEQLGDATGLTPIHVNRMIQQLRARELMTIANRTVDIHDWQGLVDVADFTTAYLLQLGDAGPQD